MRLSTARIFVRDLDSALRFYRDQLGLPLHADGALHGYLVFADAGLRLVVEVVPADAPQDDQILVARFSGLSFAVDDIAADHARLSANGVRFAAAPEQQSWGGWLATFFDPAGNQLQLVQDP